MTYTFILLPLAMVAAAALAQWAHAKELAEARAAGYAEGHYDGYAAGSFRQLNANHAAHQQSYIEGYADGQGDAAVFNK